MQFQQQPQRQPKIQWPKGVSDDISKKMSWLKGTEWRWNNDRSWGLKLNKDGEIDAPIQQCQMRTCKWTATDAGLVYLKIGDAGIFAMNPGATKPKLDGNFRLKGKSVRDKQNLILTFIRVFDHEAHDIDKDLYGALGISEDADDGEIKKVYRKLSVKYHPDKNPDEESRHKFAEIRDAYEILSDPDARILYDTGGMEAVMKKNKGEIEKTEDMHMDLPVNLADLYNGNSDYKGQLQRRVVCRGCRQKPNDAKCKSCGRCPNEVKVVNVQMGPFMTQQEQEVPSKEKCKVVDSKIDVNVEKGMREGESLTFPRMAEERPGMLPGAVILKLKTKKHPVFERRGNDLFIEIKISLQEALLGWTQKITHLDGHTVEVGTTSVTRYGQVVRAQGEGMPHRDDPESFGDLLIKVLVDFPQSLTDSQKETFSKIFAPSPSRSEL